MNWASECLTKELEASIAVKQSLLDKPVQLRAFGQAVDLVVATYRCGGRLYIAGNGGSSSDAQHLAAEFVCKLDRERPPLPAEALPADAATMTAIGNDFGYEEVFARQLQCKAKRNDAFLALTTSGNSQNIVRALERCRTLEVRSVLFAGRGGGKAARYADVSIIAPGNNSCQVQEVHIVLYHTLVRCVEEALFFDDVVDRDRAMLSDDSAESETLIAR